MSMLANLTTLYKFNEVESLFEKYPFMKENYTCVDCNPDNGWHFVEYKNIFDKKVNEEFLSDDTRGENFRLLKVKLLPPNPEKITQREGFSYKYVKLGDEDCFTLDMKDEEIDQGYRYLKIKIPSLNLRKSWITMGEIDDGWKLPKKFSRKPRPTRRKKRKVVISKPEDDDNQTQNKENENPSFVINSL